MVDRKPIFLEKGKRYFGFMPASEVCLYMKLAGKVVMFELVGTGYPMIQLYRADGSPNSFPITAGEAGVYRDKASLCYYYPPPTYGVDVDEAAYGLALQVLEVTDQEDYYLALVARAVKAGWKFERQFNPSPKIEMTVPHRSPVSSEPGSVLTFLSDCLDPDKGIYGTFKK